MKRALFVKKEKNGFGRGKSYKYNLSLSKNNLNISTFLEGLLKLYEHCDIINEFFKV